MIMLRTLVSTLALFIAFATLSGCGSGPQIESVSGTITLDGKPLPDIRVLFQPQNKDPETAGIGSFGLTDSEGKFTLKLSDSERMGAVVGIHTVILSDKLTEGAEDSDAGDFGKGPRSRIPFKYNKTPPTFEVKPGVENKATLELSSKR